MTKSRSDARPATAALRNASGPTVYFDELGLALAARQRDGLRDFFLKEYALGRLATHDGGPPHNGRPWRAADVDKDWLVVECARLGRLLAEKCSQAAGLQGQVDELTRLLGQASAGMEMADLIKRMTQ